MMLCRSLIAVVDDDDSMRESLPDLLHEFGLVAQTFASAEEFLASSCLDQARCLILDIAMPGMSGPALQQALLQRRHRLPIVFITAQAEDTLDPRLLEQGAIACLFKPFNDTALFGALQTALGSA